MRVLPKWPKLATVCFIAFSTALPVTSQATNGYFLIGYGAKSRAMGGTGIANPQDAMAAAANPAGMTDVGSGLIIGAEYFGPYRKVAAENGEFSFQTPTKDAAQAGTNRSGANVFVIPSMGMSYKFNRKITIGMSVIGNGANTRHTENFFELTGVPPNEPYGTLGVSLIQMQMLPTIAYRFNKNHSAGASLTLAINQFRAYGLGNFDNSEGPSFDFSSDPDNMTNRGNDYAYGAGVRLGWLSKLFNKKLNIGGYYASRTYMTKLDKYKGLFAEEGGFDVPEHYGIGLAIKPMSNDKFVLAADVTKILYSDINAIGNSHPTTSLQSTCTRPIGQDPANCGPDYPAGVAPVPTSQAMGENDGFGFGWRDQTIYKVGLSYQVNNKWTVRAGYNYGKTPVQKHQLLLSMLAPASTEQHLTLGFGYKMSENSTIDANYVHAFRKSVVCAVDEGCTTMLTQQDDAYAAAELKIDSLGVSWDYRF